MPKKSSAKKRKPGLILSRPEGQTLEEYKEWIAGMVAALGGNTDNTMPDEEWRKAWPEFWGPDDKKPAPRRRAKKSRV